MKIIIDAFGGDNAPLEILKGCALCADKYDGVKLVLVGNKEIMEKVAAENDISLEPFEIRVRNHRPPGPLPMCAEVEGDICQGPQDDCRMDFGADPRQHRHSDRGLRELVLRRRPWWNRSVRSSSCLACTT